MSNKGTSRWYKWVDEQPASKVLLDGGLGSILSDRGNKLSHGTLWSASLLVTNPAELQKVTDIWLQAGSDIVVTATYQVTVGSLCCSFGLSREQAEKIVKSSVKVVEESIETMWKNVSEGEKRSRRKPITGISFGPYSAILPDTTEYVGTYQGITWDDFVLFHRERLEIFKGINDEDLQVFCFETIGNVTEAQAIVNMMSEKERENIPYWISFQCRNEKEIACGEELSNAIEKVLQQCKTGNLVVLGVNCVSPDSVPRLVDCVNDTVHRYMDRLTTGAWRIDAVAYPNSGEQWIDGKWVWSGQHKDDRLWTQIMHGCGARLVGGCCRVGPQSIQSLHAMRHFTSPLR